MSDRLRLFVAFVVPEEVRVALQDGLAEVRTTWTDARWTAIESQHVTLKFLGWCDPQTLPSLSTACSDVAAHVDRGEVSLSTLGAFPTPGRARVVWAGVDDPGGTSAALAGRLDDACTSLGVPQEERPYRAHLTLCRFRRPRRLDELPQVPPQAQRNFSLEDIVLFRSHLSSQGARYEALERFPLARPR